MPKTHRGNFLGDRLFALIVLALTAFGIAMFISASLGLLAREGSSPLHLAFTQIALGLIPGGVALVTLRFASLSLVQKLAIPAYAGALLLTLLVLFIGEEYNGAKRWIDLGFTTIQPGEFLKAAVVLMLATYLAFAKDRLSEWRYGLVPFGVIVGLPILLLLLQPNTSTALVIGGTCLILYMLAGAPVKDFGIILLAGLIGVVVLVSMRPYLLERVKTFIDPSHNPHTSGYQIQQSLIAIGSGGALGRGFGQSAQKFNYLPEAQGDSVFAVLGEELGFVGTVIIVLLFTAFAARGFMIAGEAATSFGALLATGLTLIITLSAFLNIGAMLGVLPLTGLPLPFISHGGTALLTVLASVGLILNVAAHKTKARH